MLIIILTNN